MNGFFDLDNLSKKRLQKLAEGIKAQSGRQSSREAILPIMDEFDAFLLEALSAVQARAQKPGVKNPMLGIEIGFDPKEEPERFIKEAWDGWADLWPLIETVTTYQLTMLTILEKMSMPKNGMLRLASIGSGPGLYETFLARLFQSSDIGGRITCIDLSPRMAEVQNFIASLNPPYLRNLETVTADMAEIPLPDGCVDAVLCNNSLQWSKRWRKAIKEMARLLDPQSDGTLYLFVHTHKQQMHMRTSDGEKIVDMEPVLVDEIMDELERNSFTVQNTRQIKGGDGTGQMGGKLDRAFIKAKLTPGGTKTPWRKAKVSVTGASRFRVNEGK